MDVGIIFKKIDFILRSDTEEALCLMNFVDEYYEKTHKNNTQVIKFDFKKKKVIAIWEFLKDDLGEGF